MPEFPCHRLKRSSVHKPWHLPFECRSKLQCQRVICGQISFVSEPISSSLNASDCGKRSEYQSDFADFVGNCLLSKLLYLPISNSKLRSSFSFTPEVCAGPGVSAQPGWSRSQLGLDSGTKLHEPGRWAGSRHIIYFPGPGLPDQSSIGRELAGSRAGLVILPGTWKIPDIQYS